MFFMDLCLKHEEINTFMGGECWWGEEDGKRKREEEEEEGLKTASAGNGEKVKLGLVRASQMQQQSSRL